MSLIRRPLEAFEVIEVDLVTGRPRVCRRHDLLTNERGLVEFQDGYRHRVPGDDYVAALALRRMIYHEISKWRTDGKRLSENDGQGSG